MTTPADAETIAVLRRLMREVGVPASTTEAISPEEDLIARGLFDSVSLVAMAVKVEGAFGITIPTEEFDPANFASLAAVARLVARRRTDRGA